MTMDYSNIIDRQSKRINRQRDVSLERLERRFKDFAEDVALKSEKFKIESGSRVDELQSDILSMKTSLDQLAVLAQDLSRKNQLLALLADIQLDAE